MTPYEDEVYLPRLADDMLDEKLAHARAVVVRGPKWCGKTMTSERHAGSALYLQDPRETQRIRLAVQVNPAMLLEGERPRLVDEWQDAPQLWDAVRFEADRPHVPGQFILTGSSTPVESPMHSGTGRFSFLDMRTMSLVESRESTGQVSIRYLFEGKEIARASSATLDDVAYMVCRGGSPATGLGHHAHTKAASASKRSSITGENIAISRSVHFRRRAADSQ